MIYTETKLDWIVTDSLSGRSEATGFSSLVDSVADPVDAGITSDSLVGWVNEDDFVVLVDTILVDPVGLSEGEKAVMSVTWPYANSSSRTNHGMHAASV